MKNKKNSDQFINLILFLPNIDAFKRNKSEHTLFLNQFTAPSLQEKSPKKDTYINVQYRMTKQI